MIGTNETKQAQLVNGFYQTGTGPRKILILGCCRTMAYLNYLERWNTENGNQLTIYRIDPCDWNWGMNGELVDLQAALDACKRDERVLSIIRSADVFIHEYFRYYGMFNTDRNQPDNIYSFGLNPAQDICLPNFHDRFVLLQEYVNFDAEIRDEINRDGVTPAVLLTVKLKGMNALAGFHDICQKTSFPEFGELFLKNWTHIRYFWTGNHVSKHFTLPLYEMMNEKFLKLSMSGYYLNAIAQEDQFEKPNTRVTKYDIEMHNLTWGSPIEELEVK